MGSTACFVWSNFLPILGVRLWEVQPALSGVTFCPILGVRLWEVQPALSGVTLGWDYIFLCGKYQEIFDLH